MNITTPPRECPEHPSRKTFSGKAASLCRFSDSSSNFLVAKTLTQVFLIPYARQMFTHNPR